MSKNIMISISLMERIIELLGNLEAPESHNLRYEQYDILEELLFKKQKVDLRQAYANIFVADCEEEKRNARIEYLRQKSILRSMNTEFNDVPF